MSEEKGEGVVSERASVIFETDVHDCTHVGCLDVGDPGVVRTLGWSGGKTQTRTLG